MRVLVTGGAGFVGSHTVLALLDRGDEVVVLDNLRQGHRAAVPASVRLIVGDLADPVLVDRVLSEGRFDAVMHFAALSLVGESMRMPFLYFAQNAGLGIALLDACVRHGVGRFILSSTAALFGDPDEIPISERARIEPGSPYGESKLMIERALLWADRIHGLRSACLRYFNAAGADPHGRAGEDHAPETHLIPLVLDAAMGRRPEITVYGNDYATPDGTCVRDYVHVTDLASAHLAALDLIADRSAVYNLGSGSGHSVIEVIRSVERVTGRSVPMTVGARRPGDPAILVASSDAIRAETAWRPNFGSLDEIGATAHAWRVAHPDGYGDRT